MKARQKRLVFVVAGLVGLGVVATLVLYSLKGNLNYFFSPSEVVAGAAPQDRVFRLGGLVAPGSVRRDEGELTVEFTVTDNAKNVTVAYNGILPDLFAEGQGVIAQGRLNSGVFVADEVLAKHDENYMPPEVADALAKAHDEGVSGGAEAKTR